MRRLISAAVVLGVVLISCVNAAGVAATSPGDAMLRDYFERQVREIELHGIGAKTLDQWKADRGEYRRQLAEMLGLWPEPARGDLKAEVKGRVETDEFVVEKLVFQSLPGLYVTGDVYVPRNLKGRAPAILYVCGHSDVKENGVSMGNKVGYQHHGEWFARNGYVCLTIDSLELGEITGVHHGTYRDGMWWWHSRGYTPAGVETWNSMRAIDYLCTRSDVDPQRIGMTGRSGGGAYTWFTAALDERVKVAAPVAGITDLRNHVLDGCIEGHCDCMFMVNTYRWDFARVAALIAPRPLLIGNSDKDTIFPLHGVQRVHAQVRDLYHLYGQDKNLGLLITEGPHKDTQDLQVPVFRWFNRFLKSEQGSVDKVATPMLTARQLKVFDALPQDSINGRVQETFVPTAPKPAVPGSKQEWSRLRDEWMATLRTRTFGGWPEDEPALELKPALDVSRDGIRFSTFDFVSQPGVLLRLYVARNETGRAREVVLHVLDEEQWKPWAAEMSSTPFALQPNDPSLTPGDFGAVTNALKKDQVALAWVAPRGVGPTAWTGDAKKKTQILRRFALLGQTLGGMRVWDVRRAVNAIGKVPVLERLPVRLRARRQMAGIALYAALFEPAVKGEELAALPRSHANSPYLLNVLKTLDIDAALAMASDSSNVKLYEEPGERDYPRAVAAKLERPASFQTSGDRAPQWP